jgi:hypothetical protein
MESVLHFLKNAEQELIRNIKDSIERSKEVYIEEAYKGIHSMYEIPPIEGVNYECCVMIPGPGDSFYCAPFKLPHDEYIIFYTAGIHNIYNQNNWSFAVAVTNYGRILKTLPVWPSGFGGNTYFKPISDTTVAQATHGQPASNHIPITLCEPLPYKIPKLAFMIGSIFNIKAAPSDPHNAYRFLDEHRKLDPISQTIQEHSKEYYTLIGKWQNYIRPGISLETDSIREQLEEKKKETKILLARVAELESTLSVTKQQLETTTQAYNALQEEQKDYKELLKYKEILIDHLEDNLDEGCPRNKDNSIYSPDKLKETLSFCRTVQDFEWEEACKAKEEMEEFQKYQEMQKKYGKFGTTIKNTTIGIKKSRN